VAITREQVIDYLSALSPERTRELISELEELWGIARPRYPEHILDRFFRTSNPGPITLGWDLVLLEPGPQRIAVIRAMCELSQGLSLGEARTLVDSAPVVIREALDRHDANALLERLRALGAAAELR
jgi:large subunit ribosomal protein L7/L12